MGRNFWKGFTLIELIIVIIIIGILAAIGLSQYTKVVEKGRAAEARTILGTLRSAEIAEFIENGAYKAYTDAAPDLGVEAPTTCKTTHYFSYACTAGGLCTATRCTADGKTPNFTGTAYTKTLNAGTGNWGGTAGY